MYDIIFCSICLFVALGRTARTSNAIADDCVAATVSDTFVRPVHVFDKRQLKGIFDRIGNAMRWEHHAIDEPSWTYVTILNLPTTRRTGCEIGITLPVGRWVGIDGDADDDGQARGRDE